MSDTTVSVNWSNVAQQVQNAVDKAAIISIVGKHWGPHYVSKSMRKKNLNALRAQILAAIEPKLQEVEGPEIADLRARIARLDQQRCSKLMSYAEAKNPQKVLDQADAHGVEMAELEARIKQLQG